MKKTSKKKSILGVSATPERKPGPHGPDCRCNEKDTRIRVSVEFDALVPDEESGKKIAELFSAIALIVKTTGVQTRFQAGLYERPDGDEAHAKREAPSPTLDPNLN